MNFDVNKEPWIEEIYAMRKNLTGLVREHGPVERMLEEDKPKFLGKLKSAVESLFETMQQNEPYLEKVCYYVDWYLGWGDMLHGPGFKEKDPWLLSEIAKLPEPAKTVLMERYYPDRPSTLTCSKCGKIKLQNERP